MADRLSSLWGHFAHTGQPATLLEDQIWPQYQRSTDLYLR